MKLDDTQRCNKHTVSRSRSLERSRILDLLVRTWGAQITALVCPKSAPGPVLDHGQKSSVFNNVLYSEPQEEVAGLLLA